MKNTATTFVPGGLAFTLVWVVARASGADLFVSTAGSDSNPGSAAQPFRTITQAYSKAKAGLIIHVAPGVYYDHSGNWGIRLNARGTLSRPIILTSTVRGAAVIDGRNAAGLSEGFQVEGSYHIIDGFEIRNWAKGGIALYGNYNRVINNEIHHNGNPASTSTDGRDGVYSHPGTRGNFYGANSIHDNGRPGGNLDHGLYLCGQNETVVNNLVYNNAAGGLQIAGYTRVIQMKVYNNVMAWNGSSGVILWMALRGVAIKNNILYQNGRWGLSAYDAHGVGVVVDHNLCFGNGYGDYDLKGGGSDFSYKLGTTISAEPRFVNGDVKGFDAHLGAGSPARRAGLNLFSVVRTDKDGARRPTVGPWDIGAYISGAAATPTPGGP